MSTHRPPTLLLLLLLLLNTVWFENANMEDLYALAAQQINTT
jgi:hypothetical protein